jgi:hypothetical protein
MLAELLEAAEALRAARAPKLFVTDAEFIRRMGCPEKIAREYGRPSSGN